MEVWKLKAKDLREMSDDELRAKLNELKEELFSMRFKIEAEPNTAKRRLIKRAIARILTILRERELEKERSNAEKTA